jgi:hypothetical protein
MAPDVPPPDRHLQQQQQDLQTAVLKVAARKESFLQSEEASVLGLDGVDKVILAWLQDKNMLEYGLYAFNHVLPPASQVFATYLQEPTFACYTNDARTDIRDIADLLKHEGYPGVRAVNSLDHPDQYILTAGFQCAYPLLHLHQMNVDLLEAGPEKFMPTKQGATSVASGDGDSSEASPSLKYCGPHWLRMMLYLQLQAVSGQGTVYARNRFTQLYCRLELLSGAFPLEQHAYLAAFCCKEEDLQESDYETWSSNDPLHLQMYDTILGFVKTRAMDVLALSKTGSAILALDLKDDASHNDNHTSRRDGTSEESSSALPSVTPCTIHAHSTCAGADFEVLSGHPEADANDLVHTMKQQLYSGEFESITFEVIPHKPTWMCAQMSYTVDMVETIHDSEGTVRELRDTLIQFHDNREYRVTTTVIAGCKVVDLATLVILLALMYYDIHDIKSRNRLMHTIEFQLACSAEVSRPTGPPKYTQGPKPIADSATKTLEWEQICRAIQNRVTERVQASLHPFFLDYQP